MSHFKFYSAYHLDPSHHLKSDHSKLVMHNFDSLHRYTVSEGLVLLFYASQYPFETICLTAATRSARTVIAKDF